VSGTQN